MIQIHIFASISWPFFLLLWFQKGAWEKTVTWTPHSTQALCLPHSRTSPSLRMITFPSGAEVSRQWKFCSTECVSKNVCVCVCVCLYFEYALVFLCLFIHVCISVCFYTCISVYVCIHALVCVCVCVHTYINMCVCVCVCMHTYIH